MDKSNVSEDFNQLVLKAKPGRLYLLLQTCYELRFRVVISLRHVIWTAVTSATGQVINDPENVTASIGDTVNLEWTFNSGGQDRLFEVWKKAPSTALASRSFGGQVGYFGQNENGGDPKYSVIGLATLQVKDVQKEDNGPYQLAITFSNGVDLTSTAYLIVNYPPSINGITASPSSTVREGTSLTLMCNADGNPEPNVVWTRQDGGLGKAATIDANSGNLVFPNITLADKGTYTCSVDNGIPEAASEDIAINVLSIGETLPPVVVGDGDYDEESTATALYPNPRSGVGRLQGCMYVVCLLLSVFLAGPRQS
ncbi:hypothetical protein Bbelb_265600 [Branchiostoma belcheri]|nr:hypothetical protein Bbelb_265600 [Branchiostoma belcheri]